MKAIDQIRATLQPEMRGFPRVLRTLRQSLGLSQREIAAILGVLPQTFSLWEKGQRLPSEGRNNALVEFVAMVVTPEQLVKLREYSDLFPEGSTPPQTPRRRRRVYGLSEPKESGKL